MELYDYLFHHNSYTKLWYVFKREDSSKYFNGELKDVLKSKDINLLIKEINGNTAKGIKELS